MTTLIKQTRDPLYGFTKKEFLEELKKLLKGRVKQAYIFGSFTRNDLSAKSDIDLILIKDTKDSFFKRPLEFKDIYDIFPRLDLLVYTPDEFKYHSNSPVGFWKDVVRDMQALF